MPHHPIRAHGDRSLAFDTNAPETGLNSVQIRIAGVVAMVIVLTAAYTGYWYFASLQVERLVERMVAGEPPAIRITHGKVAVTGFPFSIRLRLEAPEIVAERMQVRWRSDAAVIEIQPWNLRRYRLALVGPHIIELGKVQDLRRLDVASERVVVVAEVGGDGGLSGAMLDIIGLKIADNAGSQASTIAKLEIRFSAVSPVTTEPLDPTFELSLSADALDIPALNVQPLGSRIEKVRAGFKLLGELSKYDKAAVDTWRQTGGTVEVQWLQAVWGELDLRAVGTAALDDELRPLAAMTADIRGFAEALQALATAGVISTAAARTGSMALGLIATPSSDGSPSVLTVPLTAQEGGLYLGPVRLARLPTLFR